MAVILETIIRKAKRVKAGTNSYCNDILVNETEIMAAEVVENLGT